MADAPVPPPPDGAGEHHPTFPGVTRGGPTSAAIPAATVIPLRDGEAGIEVLMVHRSSERGAFKGYWVFPGGRVDDEDRHGANGAHEIDAARRTAAREAREEVGLHFDPAALVALSHWVPPQMEEKRFSTWFFLTPGSDDAVRVDGGEIRDHEWVRPQVMLDRFVTGEVQLAPPTMVTLHMIGAHADVATALVAHGAVEPPRFHPRAVPGEQHLTLVFPGDAAYDTLDLDAPGPRNRGVMARQSFEWVRD